MKSKLNFSLFLLFFFLLRSNSVISQTDSERSSYVADSTYIKFFTSFVVGKDGYIKSIEILKIECERCDSLTIKEYREKAINTLKGMPRWEPGKKDGEFVDVHFNMPIKFTIPKKK